MEAPTRLAASPVDLITNLDDEVLIATDVTPDQQRQIEALAREQASACR